MLMRAQDQLDRRGMYDLYIRGDTAYVASNAVIFFFCGGMSLRRLICECCFWGGSGGGGV